MGLNVQILFGLLVSLLKHAFRKLLMAVVFFFPVAESCGNRWSLLCVEIY